MTNAEECRARRARAKLTGHCSTCVSRPAEPGLSSCSVCLAARSLKLGHVDWCIECQRGDGRHRFGCKAMRRAA